MQQLRDHRLDPVLSIVNDRIGGYKYLRLLAFNSMINAYEEMFCCTIYTSDGNSIKKVSSKKALFDFARKYGFKPDHVVIEDMLP